MSHDLRLALMAGIDIPIAELHLTVHQPTMRDIAFMGEKDFFMAMQYLSIDASTIFQDKVPSNNMSNFHILMRVLEQSQEQQDKKEMVKTLLLLLFPNLQSLFLPNSITLTAKGETPIVIDENNFDIFQSYIKTVLCVSNIFQGDNVVYNPANAAAKRIADKIMSGRMKVAQSKANEGSGNESILMRYISILTVGISGMTLSDCLDLTLFQLFDLIERYTAFVEWDTDQKVRLAGGKPEKPVESWMRDLHNMSQPEPLAGKGASFSSNQGWVGH